MTGGIRLCRRHEVLARHDDLGPGNRLALRRHADFLARRRAERNLLRRASRRAHCRCCQPIRRLLRAIGRVNIEIGAMFEPRGT